jgi:hypothetical protein
MYGSRVDEGGASTTIVNGKDIGPTLHRMFTSTWFMFITIPTGFIALIIFVIIASVQESNDRKKLKQKIISEKQNP